MIKSACEKHHRTHWLCDWQPDGSHPISFYRTNTRNKFFRLELIMATERLRSPSLAPVGCIAGHPLNKQLLTAG